MWKSLLVAAALSASALQGQDIPRKAGEWSIQMADGKTANLSAYHGKVVVLTFILTTCPHCQKTIGILTKLQSEYGPKGVQVLASAVNGDAKSAVPGFIQTFHPAFPVGYNEDPQKLLDFWQFTRARLPMMPIVLLIDRAGMVRYEHEGHDEKFYGDQQEQNFRAQIEELLKTSAKKGASTGKKQHAL
jgi:peroxiredoxin